MHNLEPVPRSAVSHVLTLGEAMASARVATFLTDGMRHITAANTAASQLVGYATDDLAGMSLRSLYAAQGDWSATSALIAEQHANFDLAPVQITLRTRAGRLIDASTMMIPLLGRDRQRVGTIEFVTPCDLTAQPRRPAHDADGDIVRFARGAAHDFKNLLAIITGNVQLAQSETRPKLRQTFLKDAEHACAVAARLANQMIAFARARFTEPARLNMRTVFEQHAAMLRAAAGPCTVITFKAPSGLEIIADRSGLETSLLNLVVNARDAMPDGGEITIEASVAKKPLANGRARSAAGMQDYVAISVTDTGTGMTERVRQRAFDPFFSTKSLTHGSGLGLSTVMGFARQSDGFADVTSQVGVGTTVTIYVPTLT